MKSLTRILLSLLFLSSALMAQGPSEFAGSYQGILVDSPAGNPVGKIDFTVTSTNSISGSLQLKGQKSFSFKSSLSAPLRSFTARLENFQVIPPKEGTKLELNLTISTDGTFTVNGDAMLATLTTEFVEAEGSTARLGLIAECPWAGSYTMAFPYVGNNDNAKTPPGGTSIGTATVNEDGVMTARGTLADGTKFSFSARPSEDGTYRVFINPYKTSGCFYTIFRLSNRGDNCYEVAEGDGMAGWSKLENDKEKSYRSGFDVDLDAVVVQWKPPANGETLRDNLGLGSNNILNIDFFNGLSKTTYANFLPTSLGLNLNNTFRVASANGGPSVTDQAAWAKIFSSKVDPKTGLITVTINISDTVNGKAVNRKVTVNGVLVLLEDGLLSLPYAYGHMLIPPLDKTTGTITSGGFKLPGPIKLDAIFAANAATAGTYSSQLNLYKQPSPIVTLPKGLPADDSIVDFTISSDLSEMTFGGRKIPSFGVATAFSRIYSDATDISTNNKLQVTLLLNGSGGVTGIDATYIQISLPNFNQYGYNSGSVIKK